MNRKDYPAARLPMEVAGEEGDSLYGGFGLLDLIRLRVEDWMGEKRDHVESRILNRQRWQLEARYEAETSIQKARHRLFDSRIGAEEAEAEHGLRRRVRSLSHEEQCELLTREEKTLRLLRQRDRLRSLAPPQYGEAAPPAEPAAPPSMEWSIRDDQVEAFSQKVASALGVMPPEEMQRAQSALRTELHLLFPPYVASEIFRRAQEILSYTR